MSLAICKDNANRLKSSEDGFRPDCNRRAKERPAIFRLPGIPPRTESGAVVRQLVVHVIDQTPVFHLLGKRVAGDPRRRGLRFDQVHRAHDEHERGQRSVATEREGAASFADQARLFRDSGIVSGGSSSAVGAGLGFHATGDESSADGRLDSVLDGIRWGRIGCGMTVAYCQNRAKGTPWGHSINTG